ncbi:hypothetical protein BRARA_J01902 [Brassica rapa]|uniref:Uncharacterized protein n=1 Tax=Brassica campestris TaxID=3711 RepID=A0A397XLN8_BRACM|nr:hypothetical protein BRARA_J01902 [Brassica rapa]
MMENKDIPMLIKKVVYIFWSTEKEKKKIHPKRRRFTSSSTSPTLWSLILLYNPFFPQTILPLSLSLYRLSEILLRAFFCGSKMNQYNAFVSREEMMGLDRSNDLVVCPKPRRVGVLANNLTRPLRLHMSQAAADLCDSEAGAELLDIIRRKEDNGTIGPYFLGSPPSRAANPLAQDARFRDEKINPLSPNSPLLQPNSSTAFPSPSPSSSRGCVRMKFGLKPPAVRVEGFDCLNRDRQSSSIPAMA